MTMEERLNKAAEEFKKLENRIESLEKKFIRVMEIYDNRHQKMVEIFKWYLDRLSKETDQIYGDELTNKKIKGQV